MELSQILTPASVRTFASAASKKRLLQDLSETAAAAHGVDAAAAIEALLERETLGATGVGHGIALPHARIDGLESVVGVFIRLQKPLDYDSVDKQPVDLVFGLFAPRDAGVEHLKALALVSRTLRDSGICAKLRANADEQALFGVLTDNTSNKAA